jgi:hypothetical protein
MTPSPYGYFSDDDSAGEDEIWGWDEERLVGVSLEPDGDLRDLIISEDWRRSIDRLTLAQVIVASYNRAERERLDRIAAAPVEDTPVATGEVPEVPVSLTLEVIAVQAEYTDAYRDALEEVREFRDDAGNATVSSRGGSVAGIRFDDQWLEFSSGPYIVAAVRDPLARAIRAGREIDDDMQRRYPEVAEFRRLQTLRNAARLRR